MKGRVRIFLRHVRWAVFVAGLTIACPRAQAQPAAAQAEHVYVLCAGAPAEAAADRLALLLAAPFVRLANHADAERVLADDAHAVVLVIDAERGQVARYRAGEAAPLVRAIDTPEASPYQLAFVAAEMLPLAGRAPVTAPAPPTSTPEAPALHGLARLEGGASNAVAGVWPLLELGAGAGLALHISSARALEIEVHAALARGRRRSFGDEGELALRRTRVRLRVGVSQRLGPLEALLAAELGVSQVRARLGSGLEQARPSLSAAARAEGRLPLGPRWGLFAAVAAGAQAARHGFQVAGQMAARERRYFVEGQLGLIVWIGARTSLHRAPGVE